jgi:hypothetical protein
VVDACLAHTGLRQGKAGAGGLDFARGGGDGALGLREHCPGCADLIGGGGAGDGDLRGGGLGLRFGLCEIRPSAPHRHVVIPGVQFRQGLLALNHFDGIRNPRSKTILALPQLFLSQFLGPLCHLDAVSRGLEIEE